MNLLSHACMHILYLLQPIAIAISLPKYYCDSGVRVCWNGECMVRVSNLWTPLKIEFRPKLGLSRSTSFSNGYVQLVLITMQQHLAYIHNFISMLPWAI